MSSIESQGWRRRRKTNLSSDATTTSITSCTISTNNDNCRKKSRMNHHGILPSRSNSTLVTRMGACSCVLLLSTTFIGLSTAFRSSQPQLLSPRPRTINSDPVLLSSGVQSSLATTKSRIPKMTNSHSSQLYSSSSSTSSEQQSSSQTRTTNNKTKQQQQQSGVTKKSASSNNNNNNNNKKAYKKKRKYARKLPLSPSEKAAALTRRKRRAAYEKMRTTSLIKTNEPPSIWNFDSLFAAPILDEDSVREDLYGSKEREEEMRERQLEMERIRELKKREMEKLEKGYLVDPESSSSDGGGSSNDTLSTTTTRARTKEEDLELTRRTIMNNYSNETAALDGNATSSSTASSPSKNEKSSSSPEEPPPVDMTLTRMVQDRIFGLTRSPAGSIQYSTSLLDSSRAVQFREGVRLGKALIINIDRLCHFAKKDMSHGRLEEAQEYYLQALEVDPSDGRPYLGLSRIAQRRGDLDQARGLLKEGIARSSGGYVKVKGPGTVVVVEGKKKGSSKKNNANNGKNNGDKNNKSAIDFEEEEGSTIGTIPDLGPNPFLLQALGTLEQKLGNLATAEELYLQAIRSRPSHAAAWVSLAQLRTKELRQGASAGRACYQSAERELLRIGAKPNSYVYTAWAAMEYKKGRDDDMNSLGKARELFGKALVVDPNCSVAYLQLGVMESECSNFDKAEECFETVLKFDQRNSRVLQAYAIMESRRPLEDVDSRRVLDLFERALKANPRDAGVYQAYALYVVELGDVDSARELLRRGTKVNKRHAPVWQAWGVLETRYSTAKIARDVFQQGIWSCAQPGGGQSGGRRCARLWQAWGVLEAQEGDHAAARRCFSRALDADQRNVAAVTAWTLMEAEMGNFADARSIFERSLKLFRSPSADKTAIWRAYEIMEERAGHTRQAQLVFQRSMRESMASPGEEEEIDPRGAVASDLLATTATAPKSKSPKRSREVEFSRWNTEGNEMDSDVWMNNGSIEGKVPASMMKKLKNRR